MLSIAQEFYQLSNSQVNLEKTILITNNKASAGSLDCLNLNGLQFPVKILPISQGTRILGTQFQANAS